MILAKDFPKLKIMLLARDSVIKLMRRRFARLDEICTKKAYLRDIIEM
jgi:hypothetical protein